MPVQICLTLEDLAEHLPDNETRFICLHLSFEKPSETDAREGKRSREIFIVWCPPKTNVREKFKLAATTKTIKEKLYGIQLTHNANCKADLPQQVLIERCLSSMK